VLKNPQNSCLKYILEALLKAYYSTLEKFMEGFGRLDFGTRGSMDKKRGACYSTLCTRHRLKEFNVFG